MTFDEQYDSLYNDLGDALGLGHMSDRWSHIAARLDAFADAAGCQRLLEAADELESIDPIEFALGSVDPITELRRMAAGQTNVDPNERHS